MQDVCSLDRRAEIQMTKGMTESECRDAYEQSIEDVLLKVRAGDVAQSVAVAELIRLGEDGFDAINMVEDAFWIGVEENGQFGVGA